MRATGFKTAADKLGTMTRGHGTFPLLSLPEELVQVVLGMLGCETAVPLLQSSKTMAQQVLQHSTSELELRVQAKLGKNWAATKHLLQWVPPACMKLRVCGPFSPGKWAVDQKPVLLQLSIEALDNLFGTCKVPGTVMEHFTCLTTISLQGLYLPWFVPPGLPDTCPNVHALELTCCQIVVDCKQQGAGGSSSSSANTSSGTHQHAAFPVAPNITRLKLYDTRLVLPLASGDQGTEQQQWPGSDMKQIKESLPNLMCLDVDFESCGEQPVTIWGPQLSVLSVQRLVFPHSAQLVTTHLPQLSKLVLNRYSTSDMKTVLKLPSVTHLELDNVCTITEDLSNHACTWKQLKLHCRSSELRLKDLVNLPLHSLTRPLMIGHVTGGVRGRLEVPLSVLKDAWEVARLQHAVGCMLNCGVEVLADEVVYTFDERSRKVGGVDACCATQLAAVGRVFGTVEKVKVWTFLKIGDQVVKALGMAHHHKLKQLKLVADFGFLNAGPTSWHTLMTCLPALEHLWLFPDVYSVDAKGTVSIACYNLMSEMIKQPVGRRLAVQFHYFIEIPELQSLVDAKWWGNEVELGIQCTPPPSNL